MATKTQSVKSNGPAPTVDQINADRITQVRKFTIFRIFLFRRINIIIYYFLFQLANQYWAPYTIENHLPFDGRVVEDIYMKEIHGTK
jgi:intron-binding protein aquarius